MKGSITKKNNKYCIVIYLGKDELGKKKYRWFSGYSTKKQAEKDLPKILVKLDNGELIDNNKMLFETYIDKWIKTKIKIDDLSPTTYDGYNNIIYNHLIPTIGKLKLQEIKPYNLQEYFNEKSETLSTTTLKNHYRVLSGAFIHALNMELIEKNPLTKVRLPKQKKHEITPYNIEQSKLLLDLVQNNKRLAVPVSLALLLGLRRGECLGLMWDDIDFENKVIKIRHNLEFVKGKFYLKEPKTINSIRDISAPDVLLKFLKKHLLWQKEMKMQSGGAWQNENNLVCVNPKNGAMIRPSSLSDQFRMFLKNNNLKPLRFHDLRHTNATLMLALDINSRVAQNRLGHSNISITLDLYSHVLKSVDMEAAQKINNLFNTK